MGRKTRLGVDAGAEERVEKYSNGRIKRMKGLNERLPAVEEGSEPIDSANDNIYQEADRLLRRTMAHLELLQTSVERALKDGMGTPALLKEAATVARTIAAISAELRQREKFANEIIGAMSQEEVDELIEVFFREATRNRRAKYELWLRELSKEEQGMLGH